MSTTTAASSPASSTQHTPPAQQGARPAQGQPPADLFSQLLALVGDGAALDTAGDTGPLTEAAADADGKDAETDTNPLAALMAWVAPTPQDGALAAAPGASGLVAETRSQDSRAERQAELGEKAPAGARRAGTGWQAASVNGTAPSPSALGAGLNARAPGLGGGDVPAMHWSRAAAPAEAGGASAWPVRSTVALDARLQQGSAPAGLAAAWAAAENRDEPGLPGAAAPLGARAVGDAAATLVSAAGASADAGLGGDSSGADSGGSLGEHASEQNAPQDPYAAPADAEAVEVQHWGTGALRHASLRVGDGGAEAQNAIDIQLKLQGDEVQLDIRTDDAAARELLREQAQASLGERLQQGGLTLSEFSVGSQQQQPPQQDHAAAQGATRVPEGQRTGARAGVDEDVARPAARSDGQGLDLFV